MDWFQQEEPVRRRPPRQLRSRTIGQVKWDSTHGVRLYDAETGAIQDETREPTLEEDQRSWYKSKLKRRYSDHIRSLLQDPRPHGDEEIQFNMEEELILPSETLTVTGTETLTVTGTIQQDTMVPSVISLEGPDVEPSTGSFAVLSQYLINKMDTLERQFQKWYTSLILGLGRHLDQVNASIEAIYQMGLTKREAKREDYHASQKEKQFTKMIEDLPQDGKLEKDPPSNPWTAWIAQVRLNEQEVPEFFRTSDAMKQTVEIVEDEEVLQTTTCTPKDIDKDPEGWKVAFREELDSFDRLDVMDAVPLSTLDASTMDILPCKVVMVKKPKGDGTHRKKGRVVVCGNFQQVQPGEETCANTPSFPMLRTLISLAALYRWAVESWDVSTAFLYAPLIEKRDVYCKPPQVLVKLGLVQPGTVWKLKKALYGLRTSPRAWEEERDRKLSTLTWDSPVGKVGLKPVDTTHCVWTIRNLDNSEDTPPMGMVIAYVDDLIAVGDQSQLDCMKSELDKLYVMKTSGSIPAQYQPGLEPLRFLGCLIERMPDGQIIMHQRSYIEHCFRENDMELMKGGVTLPNVDEKGSPEAPVDQYGHPTEFERSKSICQKYIGQLMWLATRTRPDISPVLGMIASQMVIRPTEMVKCLTQLWRYIKGTSSLSMTSFFPNPSSVFGKLRLNVYVDASFSSGGSRSRSGMAMYLVDTTDGSESIIQWASRRQTSMAASAPEAEVTAMAEGFATAIFLFDSLKEIRVITGFGPDCILSMKTDSAVALKQMNTHTVTVRTRTAAQKLAFLRELIYQDPQIQPIYIPGPSQRADSQTKCLSGPALRKAQEYLNLRHVVTPVVSTIRVLGMDRIDADSSAGEEWKGCGKKQESADEGSCRVEPVRLCRSQEGSLDQIHGQEGMQVSSHRTLCELGQKKAPFLCRLRMNCVNQDQDNVFLQEYRRIVTVIRQEDIGVDIHDKRSPMPFMCGSSHMPRKEEGSAHKKTKPQTPTPRGDVSTADERVKADRETQRRERAQAKQRMLQHVSVPAKASMRGHGTESESSIVRKRPAQSEDETPLSSESGALPATQAESEMSQSANTTDPQQALTAEESQPTGADPHQPTSVEESQPSSIDPRPESQADESQPDPSQVTRPVEEDTPLQTGESSTQGSSTVKRRVIKKGSMAIAAEHGSISDLRSHDTSVPSAGDSQSISTSKVEGEPRPGSVPRPPSSPREATTPKAVPPPKVASPKAISPKGPESAVASPIAASPKSSAPKAATPKKAVVKTASMPKTVSVPKALSPLGGQSPPKATSASKETVPKKRAPWSDLIEEDSNESVPKSDPKAKPKSEEPPKTKSKSGEPPKTKPKSEGAPKAKPKSEEPPKTKPKTEGLPKTKPKSEEPPKAKPRLNPAAATVTVKAPQSRQGKFLVREVGASEWPADEPKAKLPVWKKKDSFLSVFFDHKVIVAHCPTGSGKSTILPALAAMHLHPQAGRVCCTQIRRATTQSVSRNTKDIWDIDRDSLVVGYQHGTEPQEHWNQHQTKVLFLTEGIVMRQVMSHDEHTHPETILPGCRVLMLDEAHSGSTDIELILARILPRISQVANFRLVLMSATLNIDTFVRRVTDAGVPRADVGIFHMDERTNPLALYCVPNELLRERDNMELALRMIIKIHHEYREGYQNSRGSISGPILVFVPGKAEIRLLTELIKNAVKRGYTLGLYPYGFHADTPERDRNFLTNGGDDPDPSRYGELVNYNRGRKSDEKHPCVASAAARPKNPESLPHRRVIISTNAAETAVTFKDCWAVIDTCLVNQMVYDPVAKTQIHATVPCPKTASKQRAGRTGRTIPGINIKLITQQEWNSLPDTEPPQPQLEDPVPIYLRLMRHSTNEVRNRVLTQLGIEQGLRSYAMEHLWVNGMVGSDGELTPLGKFTADMEPSDPENAALLWYANKFNVLREAVAIYVILTRGNALANPKAKGLYPHPDGDFHTMVNIWNAAEWTHQLTQHMDPKDSQDSEKLTKIWGRLSTSRRQYLNLRDHFIRTTEKCCTLLSVNTDRVLGEPRTDRLAATRLSLAIFKAYKSSLMVKELAGHYSSILEPDEWRIGNTSAMTFNPSLVVTALKTVRILGNNSTAAYAPEKVLEIVMPVPEDFLISELWFCKTMGKVPSFRVILDRIQSTAVYTNMAMAQRLCPALELTPINSHPAKYTGSLLSERGVIELMQSTQWIYERGMHELQEAAIDNFQDIPIRVHTWRWSESSSFPLIDCQATYLKFPLPSSDKGSDRPLRETPAMSSYTKCVVMPYHQSAEWKRVKSIAVPETVSYKARRAQDGEMEPGEGDGQPEFKDSTERMQDLAEDEAGEGDTANQRTVGAPTLMSFSSFKSKFEAYEKGGMVLKREEYKELPRYECPLCRTMVGPDAEVEQFKSLQQLSDHAKESHDIVFYSSTTYSSQQVLCGRLVKAAHMWLSKKNETFGSKGPNKERKIKRHNDGEADAPFLDTPYVPLTTSATPIPPKLTADKVTRGPLVRPQYPVTSMATHNVAGQNLARATGTVCVQAWSVKASQGLLESDTTQHMRQIDPIFSPVDLFPAPVGDTPMGWFTPYDAKMIIRLTGDQTMETNQKLVFSLFMAAIQLIRESRLRPRLMDSVYNFMNIGIMISPTPMRQVLKSQYEPEQGLYYEDEWEYPIAVHGMVGRAEEETQRVIEWQDLLGKYHAPALPLPPKRVYHLQCDRPELEETTLDIKSSGLADKDAPVPLVIQQFCHIGLSHQSIAQASPEDNTQAESHYVYNLLLSKYREALRAVQSHVNSKENWMTLMQSSMMDDAVESAVHIHVDRPMGPVSMVKTKLKTITAGIWDMLKKLTGPLASSGVKTPATVAPKVAQEPEVDPEVFPESVPENTLITLEHNRRFDWEKFAEELLSEVARAPKGLKPAIDHKAPSVFIWHENKAWDSVSRFSHKIDPPISDPWSCEDYLNRAQEGVPSLEKNAQKNPATLNNWIYEWAYIEIPAQNEDQTPTACSLSQYLTIIWMTGLLKASERQGTDVERLFSDGDRSDLFRFLAKCREIIDPRVRKALSHYGHVPLMYAVGDGTQHYPGTDTLWADKGNSFYFWLCNKQGYFNEYNLNAESKGDLLEVCFNLYYMHTILNIDLPQLFQFDDTYLNTWCLQWAMLQRDIHVFSMSGIADITDKHPNGGDIKKLARLETVCKYYSLISKLQIEETIQSLEGTRVH